ncbi:Ethyl tert-butyl ether degradation [Fusarium albosuccineum]|uniref:Ethyl tert-butyl ether degradation n=1 Tax=Fusarium albosuccineum TaxID=1237068 RepID=A0A8H4PEZ1_9HYPO|nr:Ethyl tert-butyl ether degradation [Fusarium albosuccineum]
MARLTSTLALVAALVLATLVSCQSNTGLLQMITYVKRRSDLTRDEFWDYWQTQHAPKVVPLAAHFNISRYQQVQVGGQVLPTEAGSETPASSEPVEFDGIAMFLYQTADVLTAMLSHPYYLAIVEPDEHVFIDKEAFGNGMVATYVGTHIEAVDQAKDVWVGDEATRKKYQDIFNTYL